VNPSATSALETLRTRPDRVAALALFDSLPAVGVEEMIGTWRGSEVPTGHPLDGMLAVSGWWGKRFSSAEDVDPLVMSGGRRGGLWNLNPALVPMGLLARHPVVGRLPGAGAALRALRPVVGTRRPAARLRMTEVRGVVTATMCYDALPVHDAFRRVDDGTVLGLMDLRGAAPYVFALALERT
jgi:hypothetical protein